MDKVSKNRVKLLHPIIRQSVTDAIIKLEEKDGVKIRIVQGLRTFKEQDDLYAQGRTKPGKKITNAKGGQSWHNYGLAIDFCLLHSDGSISWSLYEDLDNDKVADWEEVVSEFKRRGFSWGGDWKSFKDNPHLEKTFDLKIADALALHNSSVDTDGYIIIPNTIN